MMTRSEQSETATNGSAKGPSRHHVWQMFDRIARRYDFLNHFLSGNRDKRWRQKVAEQLPPREDLRVLDLATGTADQLMALNRSGRVTGGVGIDLAEQMLAVGRNKIRSAGLDDILDLQTGDAQRIPFESSVFDAVTISFGIRNMSDVSRSLAEMYRVLKRDGRVIILEFSQPTNGFFRRLYLVYLRHILPHLGKIISGDSAAYRYLNETIETFPYGDAFCELMRRAGFTNVTALPLTMGIATVYRGDKP